MIPSPTASLMALWFFASPLLAQEERPKFDPALVKIAVAYAAKITASAIFVSGRTLDSVLAEELAPDGDLERLIRPLLHFGVDEEARQVTCSALLFRATAVATADLGCVLVRPPHAADALRQRSAAIAPLPGDPASIDWPLGDRLRGPDAKPGAGIDLVALGQALDRAFTEPADDPPRRTRAVVVVLRGQLVGERYATGYDATTPLPGWSMTKTMVDALVGIRVRQGKLDLDQPLAVPEWPVGDARRQLRLPDLLAMASGLQWHESYADPGSDVLPMLFLSADHAAVQASKPLAREPGAGFAYSSGTTNLICRILRSSFEADRDYWSFPSRELFGPLGMRTAVIETDPSGTFVGSSYGFATARDWARFGLLYAQDGVFAGRRILPEGWVERAARPHPASGGRYGSQLWLNADPDGDGPHTRRWPSLPADMLVMDGHEGQRVTILPVQQLVIVRLGCSKQGAGLTTLVTDVLGTLERLEVPAKQSPR